MQIFQPSITGSTGISGSLTVTSGITGSLFGTSSWARSSSYALTASYIDQNFFQSNAAQIATGSISASVNITNQSLFLINSSSVNYFNISKSGDIDVYSNLFIIRNFVTKQPILTVSQSIIQIVTQSLNPTGTTTAGSIWFTSSSMYIGLE